MKTITVATQKDATSSLLLALQFLKNRNEIDRTDESGYVMLFDLLAHRRFIGHRDGPMNRRCANKLGAYACLREWYWALRLVEQP